MSEPGLEAFEDGCRAGELRIPRCRSCARWVWYPRRRCPGCGGRDLPWTKVSGRGRLFTWVVVHRAFVPDFAGRVPFVTALVELEEDPSIRIAARLDVPAGTPLRIGMALDVAFEARSQGGVAPCFRPAARSAGATP